MKTKKFDTILFLPVLFLITYGVIMVLSASSPTAALSPECNYDPLFFFKRHIFWLFIGLGAMYLGFKLDLDFWRKFSLPIVIVSIFMLLCPIFFGTEVLGAKRWIQLGPITFQPSEFAKIALVFYLADALARRKEHVRHFHKLITILVVCAVMVVFIEKQKDLGTNIVVGATFISMLFLAGARILHIGAISLAGLLVVIMKIVKTPYRLTRLLAYQDPWADPMGTGYHIIQSLIALGSGGLYGIGLGASRQKFFYLPEKFTDFIFAVIGEELGLLYGTIPIVILFVIFCCKGLRISANARTPFTALIAGGITFQITFQAFINMGVVSALIPCTGITLPFISYGGSSLIFTLFGFGLLLNVAGEPRKKWDGRYDEDKSKHRFGPRESVVHESLSKKDQESGERSCIKCESSSQEEEQEAIFTPQ